MGILKSMQGAKNLCNLPSRLKPLMLLLLQGGVYIFALTHENKANKSRTYMQFVKQLYHPGSQNPKGTAWELRLFLKTPMQLRESSSTLPWVKAFYPAIARASSLLFAPNHCMWQITRRDAGRFTSLFVSIIQPGPKQWALPKGSYIPTSRPNNSWGGR